MRIAVLQFDVRADSFDDNVSIVDEGLTAAARAGIALVVLPEMWPTSFLDSDAADDAALRATARALDHVRARTRELELAVAGSALHADTGTSPPNSRVSATQQAGTSTSTTHTKSTLPTPSTTPSTIATSVAPTMPVAPTMSTAPRAHSTPVVKPLPTNRWHLIERGEIVASHDKIHLFTPTAEDASFTAGDDPPAWAETRAGRVGGVVCYDLRFPETTRWLFHAGVSVLAVSAQWPTSRADHLDALSTGRAVESQAFVAVCNRTGRAFVGRRRLELEFPGRSAILDPHGRVLARGGNDRELVVADVDLEVARELRTRVPVGKDERRDVYARWGAGG